MKFAQASAPKGASSPLDPKSQAIADAIRRLLGALSVSEREAILQEVSETVPPTPTPRAGQVLATVVRLFRENGERTVEEIKEQVAASKVEATDKEIYNSLGYLSRKGHIRRVGYGRYLADGALLTGHFSSLTPEQKKRVLAYRGDDHNGDPNFKKQRELAAT